MGITVIPFAIDIENVKAVFGCKDREFFNKVKSANFYENYANQADNFSKDEYNYKFDDALKDIIFKYIKPEDRTSISSFWGLVKSKPTSGLNENIGYAYGYALLVICDWLGTHLLPQCDGFYSGRSFQLAFEIMNKKGLGINFEDIFEHHHIFDIPEIKDFPAINIYSKENIHHVNSIMEKIEIDEGKANYESKDFDEVQEMLMNIRDSFKTCGDKGLEMITFTH